ncbi:MAG: hypothetical protein HYZ24_18655 [Chloroflexi bacterium]|nr:hypothetical protein [Chloroflexota bacterium]
MYYEVKLKNVSLGYSETASKKGDDVTVSLIGFFSSEDGDELIKRLEGFPQELLSLSPFTPPFPPSKVDTLIAIIRKDKTVSVYLNEVKTIAKMRIKGGKEKGEMIFTDDILDIEEVEFQDILIPDDAGVVYVFSVGWRKGFFYDFSPLHGEVRDYNIKKQMAGFLSYLMFQDRFKISENAWDTMFEQRWFPFIYLNNSLIKKMILCGEVQSQIDNLLPEIRENILLLFEEANIFDRPTPYFEDHASLIDRAIDRYKNGDYVSCTAILYPRIEGVMRTFYRRVGYTLPLSSSSLANAVVEHNKQERTSASLLLPDKFHKYLNDIYFSGFSPGSMPNVARNSVAHGEARADDFSLKSASIAILVLYQLSLFFKDKTS